MTKGEWSDSLVELFATKPVLNNEESAVELHAAIQSVLSQAQPKTVTNKSSSKLAATVLRVCEKLDFPAQSIALNATLNFLQWPETDFYIDQECENLMRAAFLLGYSDQAIRPENSHLISYSSQHSEHFLAGLSANPNLSSKTVQLLEERVDEYARPILAANPSVSRADVRRLLEEPMEQEIVAALFSGGAPAGISDWDFVFEDLVWAKGSFFPSKEFFEECLKSIYLLHEDEIPEKYLDFEPVEAEMVESLTGDETLVEEWWEGSVSGEEFQEYLDQSPPTSFVQYYRQDSNFRALVDSCSWEPMTDWVEFYQQEID